MEDDFFVNVMDHLEGKELSMLRNEDTISLVEFLAKKIKFTITSWVSVFPQFQGIPVDLIVRKWRVVALSNMGV